MAPRNEGASNRVTSRARLAMERAWRITGEQGLTLSLAALFIACLEEIDSEGRVLDVSQKRRFARELASVRRDSDEELFKATVAKLFERMAVGELPLVSTIGLLEAALEGAEHDIGAVLSKLGTTITEVVFQLRTLATEQLHEPEEQLDGPSVGKFRFAVVTEGDGFVHDWNRYVDIDTARRAVAYLEQLKAKNPITPPSQSEGFFINVPDRLLEATRIYVKEL